MKSKWKDKLAMLAGWLFITLAMLLTSSCNNDQRKNVQAHPGSPISAIASGIRTVRPVQKEMTIETEASGIIAYDTRRSHSIPIRFSGRIERLHVHYNFEPVSKGQKLLEIYSPEIVTAQKELLYLMESDPGNKQLIGAARQKLSLLGLSQEQIALLVETGGESYSLPIYSPYSGYIYEESAGTPAFQATASQPSQLPQATQPSQLSIREGMYLKGEQTAFRVINTNQVWAELDIYPDAMPHLKKGDSLRIIPDFNPELALAAKVDFLEPFYQDGEMFSKVRVFLDNSEGQFKPGQLVTAHFQKHTDSAWWVPVSAVLDLGTKNIVFLKQQQAFYPVPVQTGRIASGFVEIISGIAPSDTIAYEGHYMVDSEGFIPQHDE